MQNVQKIKAKNGARGIYIDVLQKEQNIFSGKKKRFLCVTHIDPCQLLG
jgi:hypothetical protein